jgi:hypothetical protein
MGCPSGLPSRDGISFSRLLAPSEILPYLPYSFPDDKAPKLNIQVLWLNNHRFNLTSLVAHSPPVRINSRLVPLGLHAKLRNETSDESRPF